MRYILSLVIALTPASLGHAQQPERQVPLPYVTLVQPPAVATLDSTPLPPERIAEIESLIDKLTDVERTDLNEFAWGGYNGSLRSTFVPVGRFDEFGRLTRREIEVHQPIRRLIEIGPDAMPYLLKSLENGSPTGVVIPAPMISVPVRTAFDEILQGNPANPTERFVLNLNRDPYSDSIHPQQGLRFGAEMESYRLKIGDVCLPIIGEIVGRDYNCIRNDGERIHVCSPVHRKKMRDRVRRIWGSENPRQKVLESLLMDFSTRGLDQGYALSYWDVGNNIQIQSVLRLLYYYPDVATPLIAQRLQGLRISDDYIGDCFFNGIRTDFLIDAVGWSRQEAIKTALPRIATAVRDEKDMEPSRARTYILEALQRAEVELPKE